MTDLCLLRDTRPVALSRLQSRTDLLVEGGFHNPRIATFCYSIKQPIARGAGQSQDVPKPPITETLAENLEHFMTAKGVVQKELAKRSGIGQTTISLYLNPGSRNDTASGKPGSPALVKVEALADALEVELWELLRPLTPAQRDLIRSVDALIAERTGTPPDSTPDKREKRPKAKREQRRRARPRKPSFGKQPPHLA